MASKTDMLQSSFEFLLKQNAGVQDVPQKVDGLIRNGFDIHSLTDTESNRYKTTALHLASREGNESIVFALLDNENYQVEQDILRCDVNDGDTAIHMASFGGKLRILKALFSSLECLPTSSPTRDQSPDWQNKWGQTPLHYALAKGYVDVVRYLISKGANVEATDLQGAMGIHFAARGGHVECLQEVLISGVKVNATSNAGLTALHYAAWNNRAAAVELLLERGANIDMVDRVEEGTPLHWAVMRGIDSVHTLQQLVEAHVKSFSSDILGQNKYRKNVLEIAEKHQTLGRGQVQTVLHAMDNAGLMNRKAGLRPSIVKYVLAYGNEDMNEKVTNMMVYVEQGKPRIREFLENHGVIEWAASKGNVSCVANLVKLVKNIWGNEGSQSKLKAALQVALYRGKITFAEAIVQHVARDQLPDIIMGTIYHFEHDFLLGCLKELEICCTEQLIKEVPFAFFVFYSTFGYEARHDIAKFIEQHKVWDDIVNMPGKGHQRTALHWAVILNRVDIVRELCRIEHCKGIGEDAKKWSAYRYAVEMKRSDVLKEMQMKQDVRSYLDLLYKERQVYIDASHAMLVGATLIAGISFAGFLHLLLPLDTRRKEYINHHGAETFFILISLSFFFAMGTALVGARGVLPMPHRYIGEVVKHILWTLWAAAFGLVVSIVLALAAFATASLTILPPVIDRWYVVFGTTLSGASVCLGMLIWFIKGICSMGYSHVDVSQTEVDVQHNCSIDEVIVSKSASNTISGVYEVGYFYSDVPWDDGLNELIHRDTEASLSPVLSLVLSSGRVPEEARISIGTENQPLLKGQ